MFALPNATALVAVNIALLLVVTLAEMGFARWLLTCGPRTTSRRRLIPSRYGTTIFLTRDTEVLFGIAINARSFRSTVATTRARHQPSTYCKQVPCQPSPVSNDRKPYIRGRPIEPSRKIAGDFCLATFEVMSGQNEPTDTGFLSAPRH